MKKINCFIMYSILTVLSISILYGCSNNSTESSESTTESTTIEETTVVLTPEEKSNNLSALATDFINNGGDTKYSTDEFTGSVFVDFPSEVMSFNGDNGEICFVFSSLYYSIETTKVV